MAKKEKEVLAYCSKCWKPVNVLETNEYIKCLSCGHTKKLKDVKMLSGIKILKRYQKHLKNMKK